MIKLKTRIHYSELTGTSQLSLLLPYCTGERYLILGERRMIIYVPEETKIKN
jgi:hypothetical protein